MNIFQYLVTLGETAIRTGIVFTLGVAIESVFKDIAAAIEGAAKQLFLLSATGMYLERWAWDLLQFKRKPLESDSALLSRILRFLFLANGTRNSIREAVKALTGQYPTELYEPVVDSAYFNAGFYMVKNRRADSAAGADGVGTYCARYAAAKEQEPYVGYVKVQLPGQRVGGSSLAFYDGEEFYGAAGWPSDANPQRQVSIEDVCAAVKSVKVQGTRVYIETF